MTWMKNSSCMDLLRAAKLWRPLGGKTRHRGGRWKLPGAIGGVGLGRQAMVAANTEEGMSHHDQSHMPVQPGPEPALIVVQPQFSFGILVEPLDYPPVVGQDHLVLEAQGVQAPGEAVFGLSLLPRQGALPDEPTCSREGFASTTNPVNPHSSELLGQIALGPFPPGNSLPSILEQLFQESVGLSTWYPFLQTAGPSWSTLALVRRGWLFSGEQLFSDVSELAMMCPRQSFLFVPRNGLAQYPTCLLSATGEKLRQENQTFVPTDGPRHQPERRVQG